jgi:PAS domain S-box-containing protein
VVLVKQEAAPLQPEEATTWLAAIVSSSTDAIITMTCGGVVKSLNPTAVTLFGFSAEEIIGLPASVLIPADRQEEWRRALTRIAAGENITPYDTIRLDKSGNRIEVFISISPLRNAGGTIIGALQIAHGVSSGRRAEKALRDSDVALESGHTGIWHLNLIEHTATRSLEHDRIFGYSAQLPEWTYEMFLDHVLPQDRASVDEAFRRATNERSDWSFECRIRRADGEVRWIWAAGRHLVAGKGAPPEMVGIVQDITGHKEREEQIRRLAAFNQAALKSLGEGLYAIDCQGLVTFMNPAAEELFGWSFAELRGKKMHDMTHHHYRDGRPFPSSECAGFQVLTHGTPIKNHEDVFIRKDGTFFDVIYTNTPLRDDSGTITGLIVVFSDMTERKRAEERLRRQADLLDQSHDAILVWKIGGAISYWSKGAERLYGWTSEQAVGHTSHDLLRTSAPIPMEELEARIAKDGHWHGELVHTTRDGRTIVVESHHVRVRYGGEEHMLETNRDISERKRHEKQVNLLVDEVNHRSKNMLSIVQAIAGQTAAASPNDFMARFTERLQALAASQDLLVKSAWQGVELVELVRSQIAHFEDLIGQRIDLRGPPIWISASAAQTIGMAVHELANNSGKYGALSNACGVVKIAWDLERIEGEEAAFVMSWREEGGPPVTPPRRRGFGSTIIAEMAKMNLGAKVDLDYPATGLRWHLKCPAVEVLAGSQPPRSAANGRVSSEGMGTHPGMAP